MEHSKKVAVIVSVPHAECSAMFGKEFDPKKLYLEHWCDITAKANAEGLVDLLKTNFKRIGINVDLHLHVAKGARQICDLNRSRCRNEPYRVRLREELRRARQLYDTVVLLDVHSFPPNEFENNEFVILQDTTSSHNLWQQSLKLVKLIEPYQIRAALYQGERNSIIEEAVESGVPSFLFEFNETLEGPNKLLVYLQIFYWLADLLAHPETLST